MPLLPSRLDLFPRGALKVGGGEEPREVAEDTAHAGLWGRPHLEAERESPGGRGSVGRHRLGTEGCLESTPGVGKVPARFHLQLNPY